MLFDFVKFVEIRYWVSGVLIERVAPDVALMLMLRSNRFDNGHASANVRQLHPDDAFRRNLVACEPVTFHQD